MKNQIKADSEKQIETAREAIELAKQAILSAGMMGSVSGDLTFALRREAAELLAVSENLNYKASR